MKKLTSNQKNRKFNSLLSCTAACLNAVLIKKIRNKVSHKGFNLKTKLFADDAIFIDNMLKKTMNDRACLKIETVADAMVAIALLSENISNEFIFKR